MPLQLAPRYDGPWIISDEQLEQVLGRLYPRLRGPEPKINFVDHAFRFWGPNAVFDDPEALSGKEMRDLLVDHEAFARAWPSAPPPLDRGRVWRGISHARRSFDIKPHGPYSGQFGRGGNPLDYPIVTTRRRTTKERMLHGRATPSRPLPSQIPSIVILTLQAVRSATKPISSSWALARVPVTTTQRAMRRLVSMSPYRFVGIFVSDEGSWSLPESLDCMNTARRLWRDESGEATTMSLILIATIIGLGVIVGVVSFRDQLVQEFGDAAISRDAAEILEKQIWTVARGPVQRVRWASPRLQLKRTVLRSATLDEIVHDHRIPPRNHPDYE